MAWRAAGPPQNCGLGSSFPIRPTAGEKGDGRHWVLHRHLSLTVISTVCFSPLSLTAISLQYSYLQRFVYLSAFGVVPSIIPPNCRVLLLQLVWCPAVSLLSEPCEAAASISELGGRGGAGTGGAGEGIAGRRSGGARTVGTT